MSEARTMEKFLLTRPLRDVTISQAEEVITGIFLLTRPLRDVTAIYCIYSRSRTTHLGADKIHTNILPVLAQKSIYFQANLQLTFQSSHLLQKENMI